MMTGVGSTVADKYVLLEQLGAGGVGVVHRAAQPALSRCVAVKLLHRALVGDPDAMRRFRAEALAASRFDHPNSVMVLDHGTAADGTPYIVMEYVRGESLRALLGRDRWLPLARVLGIARQLLAALGAAHRAGVVHGDVKIDNILIEPTRDGGDRVKIVDFGLAELSRDSERAIAGARCAEGTVAGTPEYMAPEVIRGGPATPLADLYGVGIVIYELLTGKTPFAGGSSHDVMDRHVHDELVLPSLRRPDLGLSHELEAVIARALAKPPAARFRDAEAFIAALVGVPAQTVMTVRCESCGERGAAGARFCVACGTEAGEVAPASAAEAVTQVARGTTRHDPATIPSETQHLRSVIGAAIVDGDVTAIAAGYLDLARALRELGRTSDAIRELEEALELFGAGHGRTLSTDVARLARMLVALRAARHRALEESGVIERRERRSR